MFQFPGFPSHTLCVQVWITQRYLCWVPSFGNPRVTGYLLLTVAYRSLSRPSSAPCTKASTSMLFVAWTFSLNSIISYFSEFLFLLPQKFFDFNSTNCFLQFRSFYPLFLKLLPFVLTISTFKIAFFVLVSSLYAVVNLRSTDESGVRFLLVFKEKPSCHSRQLLYNIKVQKICQVLF